MLNFLVIFLSVFGLDLLTKALVRAHMPLGDEINVLPFFSLTHVTNTGIAFGMFQNSNLLFAIVGVAVAAALTYYGLSLLKTDPWGALLMAGIIGGALGNLYDRIVHGRVTDFLDFYLGVYHWPAFNVADSAICVGAVLLFLNGFRQMRRGS